MFVFHRGFALLIDIHNTVPEAALLALVQRNRDSPGRDVRGIFSESQFTHLDLSAHAVKFTGCVRRSQ